MQARVNRSLFARLALSRLAWLGDARPACYSHRPLVCSQSTDQRPAPGPLAHRNPIRRLDRQEGCPDTCAATTGERGEWEGRAEHVRRAGARRERREGQRVCRGSCGTRCDERKGQREGGTERRRRFNDRGTRGEEGEGRLACAHTLDLFVYRPSLVLLVRQLSANQHRLRHFHSTSPLCAGAAWTTHRAEGQLLLAAASAVHRYRRLHVFRWSGCGLSRRMGGQSRQCAIEGRNSKRNNERLRRRGALPNVPS